MVKKLLKANFFLGLGLGMGLFYNILLFNNVDLNSIVCKYEFPSNLQSIQICCIMQRKGGVEWSGKSSGGSCATLHVTEQIPPMALGVYAD